MEPLNEPDPNAGGGGGASGAVPHHTYDLPATPWAPAGNYTVRLSVDGQSYTQPLSLRLDPPLNEDVFRRDKQRDPFSAKVPEDGQ